MANELAHPVHPNTRRTKLRRIGVMSMATTQALIMMAFSLVVVLIYAVIGGLALAFGAAAASTSSTGPGGVTGPSPAEMAGLGIGVIIAMVIFIPILYGAFGFIFGALGALVYNLVAKWTGGIEMEFLDREDARPY